MSDTALARVSLVDARVRVSAFNALRPRLVPSATPVTPLAEPDHFALGYAAGEQAATEAFANARAALAALVAGATALQPEPTEELAALIAVTVERLVAEIVGRTPIDRSWLVERIARAMSAIEEADAARTLWLHPEDIVLLGDTPLPLATRADDMLERGALRIECARGAIEDSRSSQLAALGAALGIEASA